MLNGGNVQSATWTAIPAQDVVYQQPSNEQFLCKFNIAGRYNVIVNYTDSTGVRTVTRSVVVVATATAAFNASLVTSGYPNQLILTNYSKNALSTLWTFNHPDATDSLFNTTRSYTLPGAYKVTLLARGKGGCDDEESFAFYINDSSGLTMPNVFTPNEDGVNDVYRPICRGMVSFKATVFNRDGIQIWDWHGMNGVWDGRTYSGEKCPDGVYFIVAESIGFDGRTYKEHKHVTLIR